MAISWAVKELLTAVKMNNFGVRRMSDAEQLATLNSARLLGDNYYNTDHKTLQIYQTGDDSNFDITQLSNFLYRDESQIGAGSSTQTLYDEAFINNQGKMNTRVFVLIEYLKETSQAWSIDAIVTDGSSPITTSISGGSDPSPVPIYDVLEINTTSFTIDDILNIKLDVNDAQIQFIEMRGV